MNDILRALKEAGLVDDKTERRIRHDERVRKKGLGREGRKSERDALKEKHEQREQDKKQQTRAAQKQHDTVHDRDAQARQARDGFLPAIALDDGVARRLEAGELALVESPTSAGQVRVVPRPVAQELESVRPELVLHLAGRKGPARS